MARQLLRQAMELMDTRKTTHSSAESKETSPALSRELGDPAVGLPSDLATSLRYLENSELQRLQVAVEAEIARRKPGASTGKADEVFAPTAADQYRRLLKPRRSPKFRRERQTSFGRRSRRA